MDKQEHAEACKSLVYRLNHEPGRCRKTHETAQKSSCSLPVNRGTGCRLTDRTITTLKLPKGKTEALYFDADLPGFGIRMWDTGGTRWVYQYKIGTKHRRITLGNVAALSATRARQTAAELHARVKLGEDPAAAKAEGQLRAGETMGALLEVYLAEKRTAVKPGSFRGIERHLRKHCRSLHGLQLGKIDRRTVAARIAEVAAKSGAIESNRVRASLQAFFSWCIARGLADHNPVVGTDRKAERTRDRVLGVAELKAIWEATADGSDYSSIVRLLMLTGQRADEIASLSWPEVVDGSIVLPATRTKNSREHVVPLAPAARAILDARPHGNEFVFGRREGRPFTGWSVCKAALDQRLQNAGSTFAWVTHDLRRSAATRMAEDLNIPPHVIEAVLNHVSGHKHGVHGIYNRSSYNSQKAQALAAWAEHLLGIVEGRDLGNKVVKLHA